MRLSVLASLIALPAVAYAAATSPRELEIENRCYNYGQICTSTSQCCGGLKCEPVRTNFVRPSVSCSAPC